MYTIVPCTVPYQVSRDHSITRGTDKRIIRNIDNRDRDQTFAALGQDSKKKIRKKNEYIIRSWAMPYALQLFMWTNRLNRLDYKFQHVNFSPSPVFTFEATLRGT